MTTTDASEGEEQSKTGSDPTSSTPASSSSSPRDTQAVDFESDDPAFAGAMTMTWRLQPVDAGTTVEITAEDVPEGITPRITPPAWSRRSANLAGFLERPAPQSTAEGD